MRNVVCVALLCLAACGSSTKSATLSSGSDSSTGSGSGSTGAPTPAPQPGTAGGTGTSNGNATAPNVTQSVPASSASYTYVGRFDKSNANAPVMALEQSKVGASFTGRALSVKLSSTGSDYFDVVIDNAAPIVINANRTISTTIAITTELAAGSHTVWMSKRTEFTQYNATSTEGVGETTFYGFVIEDTAAFQPAPAAKTRRMEFLGDSGFTGYGVDQLDKAHTSSNCFQPSTENGDESVPGFAGTLLDADVVNDSWSGEAVYLSAYDANPAHDLPTIYGDTLPPNSTPAWDFSSWTADVVVISAGGDDLAGDNAAGYFPDPNAFQTSYVNWLTTIRGNYPNAVIISVLSQAAQGNDIVTLGGALQQAVATRNAAGDANVFYYNYFAGTPYTTYDDAASALQLYWGCSGHPSAAGAKWLAQQLATFVKTKINW